jgi:F-type H+-transporting ATPase subunit b
MNPLLLMVISNLLNFGILAFLLWKFLVPRISEGMDNKQRNIVQTIEETEKNLADMSTELEAVRAQMRDAEPQIQAIRDEADARGKAAAEKIMAETVTEISALRHRVDRQIEQEVNNLRLNLRQELVDQVMANARNLLQQDLNKIGHSELVEHFAHNLKGFKEYTS